MSCKLTFRATLAALWMLGAVSAGADYVLLANGFRLRVERQEKNGSAVRLFIPGGGYVDVALSQVSGYQKEEALSPPPTTELADVLEAAGARHGLDPVLLESVIAAESDFNPRAVSPKGAAGLMQLMPATAEQLRVKDVFNPAENVQGGARYLRNLLDRYGKDLAKALAAYNAGPETVDRYRGIPPYPETQNYVRRVIHRFNRGKTKR